MSWHARLALVENEQRTRQAVRNLRAFMNDPDAVLESQADDRVVSLRKI